MAMVAESERPNEAYQAWRTELPSDATPSEEMVFRAGYLIGRLEYNYKWGTDRSEELDRLRRDESYIRADNDRLRQAFYQQQASLERLYSELSQMEEKRLKDSLTIFGLRNALARQDSVVLESPGS